MNRYNTLEEVMKWFIIFWVSTVVGMFVGGYLPEAVMLPLSIATLVILIVSSFLRKSKKGGIKLGLLISFLIGITLRFSVGYYVGALGGTVVLMVILSCAVFFSILAFIGFKLRKDLTSWGNILFIILIGLVIFSLVGFIVPFSDILVLVLSGVGFIIFSLFTVFDMNRIAKGHVREEDIGIVALGLYLNLVNMILDALRFIGILSD